MRGGILLLALAVSLAAGCFASDVSESSDETGATNNTCADVGDEYERDGAQGEHCPNETPGQWMANESI